MKILIVGQLPIEAGGTYTTGVCNVVYELSKCANKDFEIVVYATNMKSSFASAEGHFVYRGTIINPFASLTHLLRHPISTVREWLFYHRKCHSFFLRYDAYRYNIERIIKEEKPDVIHCMSVCQMASCYYANIRYKIPLILTSHGIDANPYCEFLSVMKMADVVTGLTPEIIQWLNRNGVPQHQLAMIPNGTDVRKFYYSEKDRDIIRNEIGVNANTTVLLTIGALCHRKGQMSFLSKLREIPNEFDFVYLIIGIGEDEDKLKSYIEQNNMQERVKMLGYVSNNELYRYHSAADVYVHCSRSEGQALSEIEAYTTDLKIAINREVVGTVITDTSNHDDYWIFDYDSFDVGEFISWASCHKNARITREQYDWNKIFKMYSECYSKLFRMQKK